MSSYEIEHKCIYDENQICFECDQPANEAMTEPKQTYESKRQRHGVDLRSVGDQYRDREKMLDAIAKSHKVSRTEAVWLAIEREYKRVVRKG